MTVIEITTTKEIPPMYTAYVCEPSAESAAAHYQKRTGRVVDTVYRYTNKIGRVTIMIPEVIA